MDTAVPCAYIQVDHGWLRFADPREMVSATRVDDILPALRRIEAAVDSGLFAAGFLAYEAAPAFDPAFVVPPSGALPLLWFGLFDAPERLDTLPALPAPPRLSWSTTCPPDAYRAAIARIKAWIAAGDTYQVNYTHRLRAPVAGDPWPLFLALCRAQRGPYSAYIDLGRHALCSASPELFFDLDGAAITCRPMKGTAPRGRWADDDAAQAAALQASEKNRAENLMIVDMLRNDLSRIARIGSVTVPRLFDVERYETLWQLTSTVTAETDASVSEILAALFPCASITGAPKVRTMEIIAALEPEPRGIYTGTIGYLAPGRRAQFNVAIRTVHVDRAAGMAEYGTGGGVVWDSTDEGEYAESLLKTQILTAVRPDISLLETLAWRPATGYALLDRHLERIAESAAYFGYRCDREQLAAELARAAAGFTGPQRVRMLLDAHGAITVESTPLLPMPRRRWRVAMAPTPIDRDDRYLYHKTTRRGVYEAARAASSGVDDVLLWNADGEVTESTIANIAVRLDGDLGTPPLACGLLPGTLRAEALARGRLRERVITRDDLARAEAVFLFNSVRGWIPADLMTPKA